MEHNDPLTVAQAISDYGPYAVILAFMLVLFLYCICNINRMYKKFQNQSIKNNNNLKMILPVWREFKNECN